MKFKCKLETAGERIEAIAAYFPIIHKIENKELAEKVANVWIRTLQECPWDDLNDAAFSVKYPKERLIAHIRVVTEGAYAVASLMNEHQNTGLDLDLIVALGLLHDVSKCLEYVPDGENGAKYSEIGKKTQHAFYGAMYVLEENLGLDFVNLMISHTPQSNTHPVAREGNVLAFLDCADADMINALYDAPMIFYNRMHG